MDDWDFDLVLVQKAPMHGATNLSTPRSVSPGGWDELRDRNWTRLSSGRSIIAGRLPVALPAPNSLVASMACTIRP